ncbi:hypothetical protein HDV06_005966 [Boothiomyces sp. JEL0866]|nr:hypothetical protein HDV06_005966 [Boothiomyces sp. JEL0866]
MKSDECPVCKTKSTFVPSNSSKLNQVLTPVNVHLEDLNSLLNYQTNQCNDLISYLKKSCLNYCLMSKKNESNYTHSKLLLKQAYEENQRLKRENEVLKRQNEISGFSTKGERETGLVNQVKEFMTGFGTSREQRDGKQFKHDTEPDLASRHFQIIPNTMEDLNSEYSANQPLKMGNTRYSKYHDQPRQLGTANGKDLRLSDYPSRTEKDRYTPEIHVLANHMGVIQSPVQSITHSFQSRTPSVSTRLDRKANTSSNLISRYAPSPAKSYQSRLTLQSRERPRSRLLPSRDRSQSRIPLTSNHQFGNHGLLRSTKSYFESNNIENPFL